MFLNLIRVKRFIIAGSLTMVLAIFSSFMKEQEKVKYKQRPTIIAENSDRLTVAYRDTLNDDSLYLVKTKENIPIHYFRNIATEVCFDNQCRLLDITVFWNITGRYLGFELPDGEFLSKYDHEPFVPTRTALPRSLIMQQTVCRFLFG
jgi:hypothetical protein